jgi:hypothetical protein
VINPLTGQPIVDASLLQTPALLVSISHFPATARPQAGLSFAPFVYEFYITEGATRFLAAFYGQFPAVESPVTGGCETRQGAFVPEGQTLGNLVWFDSNANGLQDPGEGGVSGMCVNLLSALGEVVQRTTTDSNGFYGFHVGPGSYQVEFVEPADLSFTRQHAGRDDQDNDADPATGRAAVQVTADIASVDAGMVSRAGATTAPGRVPKPPAAQVGPIRSGRLVYRHIARYFHNSCLIYASASPEVLALLPKCLSLFHQISGGGVMMPISDLRSVADKNRSQKGSSFDYAAYAYSARPSESGETATELREFFAYQNQSGWIYDPLYESYLRYVDTSVYAQAGILHPETDRLTGRQLHFENVIVLFAKHQVISPTNLDIHLEAGRTGKALLFRDGQVFKMTWTTAPQKDQDSRGPRPIQFLSPRGEAMPLKPGHTWIVLATPESTVEQQAPGRWLLTFVQPAGAK